MDWELVLRIAKIIVIPILIFVIELFFHPLKKLYESWLKRGIEKYKADLQKKMEGHRIRLDKANEISGKLVNLKNIMFELTQTFSIGPPPSKDELMRKTQDAAKDLLDTIDANRYCFDKDTCRLFSKLENRINQVWKNYQLSRMLLRDKVEESTRLFNVAHKIATEEIPSVIGYIQDKFRKMIG